MECTLFHGLRFISICQLIILVLSSDKATDVFSWCAGGQPDHHLCASNGTFATWVPCLVICQPDAGEFLPLCMSLCPKFIADYGKSLIDMAQEENSHNALKSEPNYVNTLSVVLLVIVAMLLLSLLSIAAYFLHEKRCIHVLRAKLKSDTGTDPREKTNGDIRQDTSVPAGEDTFMGTDIVIDRDRNTQTETSEDAGTNNFTGTTMNTHTVTRMDTDAGTPLIPKQETGRPGMSSVDDQSTERKV